MYLAGLKSNIPAKFAYIRTRLVPNEKSCQGPFINYVDKQGGGAGGWPNVYATTYAFVVITYSVSNNFV